MNGIALLSLGILLAVAPALSADEGPRLVRAAAIPGVPQVVVVAEGELEPRGVGSYSLRVYAAASPRFPYDDFVAGTVRPRDGTVEDVRFSDLDRDGVPDIVVVIRSAGTGGYLSADAFRLRGTALTLLGSVLGLPSNADPILALEGELARGAGLPAAPDVDKLRR